MEKARQVKQEKDIETLRVNICLKGIIAKWAKEIKELGLRVGVSGHLLSMKEDALNTRKSPPLSQSNNRSRRRAMIWREEKAQKVCE